MALPPAARRVPATDQRLPLAQVIMPAQHLDPVDYDSSARPSLPPAQFHAADNGSKWFYHSKVCRLRRS